MALTLPASAVVALTGRAALLQPNGTAVALPAREAARRLRDLPPPLLVHAPATLRRLGTSLPGLDLLELFAFVHPARSVAPTPLGLAMALDMVPETHGPEALVTLLPGMAELLLNQLAQGRGIPRNRDAAALAARMGQAGWGWAPYVLAALGAPDAAPNTEPFRVWRRLPEWEEAATPPAPGSLPVGEAEARNRLAQLLGSEAEQRPGQADYAGAAAAAFAPRESRGDPVMVLAEAGTGTGKTIGYIAPASLWAERNKGAVWI